MGLQDLRRVQRIGERNAYGVPLLWKGKIMSIDNETLTRKLHEQMRLKHPTQDEPTFDALTPQAQATARELTASLVDAIDKSGFAIVPKKAPY
jgi:hypothetical protein